MPDIEAQTPDGVVHSFPDGTPPEVITGAIKKYLGVSSAPSKAEQDQWEDVTPGPAVAAAAKTGGDEWEDVNPTAGAPATPDKPGFFRTVGRDVLSMVKPLAGQGGTQLEDPEEFRRRYAAMSPEQQAAQREQTRQGVVRLGRSDINSVEGENYRNRIAAGQSMPRALAETTYEAGAGANMTGFDEAVREGRTAEAFGHLAAPVILGAATHAVTRLPEFPEAVRVGTQDVRDSIGNAMRTEEGALKPGVRSVARVGGGAVGAAVGSTVGAPSGGAIVGGMAGPGVVDLITPKRPPLPGVAPSLPDVGEFYANEGAERNAILKRGENEPQTGVAATLPDAGAFYENKAVDLMTRQKAQDALDRAKAREDARASKSRISIVGEGGVTGPRATGSEGRAATWTNERVLELAAKGNRDAIAQVGRRQLPMPPNVRYVMGDVDAPRVVLNPREVTRFTPEGVPIRDSSNPVAQSPSSRARIQIVEPSASRVEPPYPREPVEEPQGAVELGPATRGQEIPSVEQMEDALREKGMRSVEAHQMARETIAIARGETTVPDAVRQLAFERIARVLGPNTRRAVRPLMPVDLGKAPRF